LAFEVLAPLAQAPEVTATLPTEDGTLLVPFTPDSLPADFSTGSCRYSYTATQPDVEGAASVRIHLLDQYGNPVEEEAGEFEIDVTPPQITVAWQYPDAKQAAGAQDTFGFSGTTEPGVRLASDRDLGL